jgi:hypothetical protein
VTYCLHCPVYSETHTQSHTHAGPVLDTLPLSAENKCPRPHEIEVSVMDREIGFLIIFLNVKPELSCLQQLFANNDILDILMTRSMALSKVTFPPRQRLYRRRQNVSFNCWLLVRCISQQQKCFPKSCLGLNKHIFFSGREELNYCNRD